MVSTLVVGTNTYATRAQANTYLGDSSRASAWAFLSNDAKDQALLTATRLFERQCWIGTQTGTMQWPRSGVTDKYGVARSSSTVPQEIVDGQIELAFEISQDTAKETSGGEGTNTKRLKAGSAEIEYFRPTAGVNGQGSSRFPTPVMELVGQFMCGATGTGIAGAYASGTDQESSFTDSPTFGLDQPL